MNTFDGVKARCVDGEERTFHQTGEADTFFSVPGFVYTTIRDNGRKRSPRVYGFLSSDTEEDGETTFMRFIAYTYRKNHALIVPAEKIACPDGGTCHHGCEALACFRVNYAEPLSGVYPDNQWPAKVVETHGLIAQNKRKSTAA